MSILDIPNVTEFEFGTDKGLKTNSYFKQHLKRQKSASNIEGAEYFTSSQNVQFSWLVPLSLHRYDGGPPSRVSGSEQFLIGKIMH